jgi:hypothetical protein
MTNTVGAGLLPNPVRFAIKAAVPDLLVSTHHAIMVTQETVQGNDKIVAFHQAPLLRVGRWCHLYSSGQPDGSHQKKLHIR